MIVVVDVQHFFFFVDAYPVWNWPPGMLLL